MRKLQRFRVALAPGTAEETTRFGEFVNPATGEKIPYVDKLARIFKAGVHRGLTYTGYDIDRLVTNFPKPAAEIEWDRPVYKDHNPDNRSIENMVGNIRSLERQGQGMTAQLWGWLRFIGQDAVNNVVSGVYRKLSAGIFYDTMEVDEVSVLADPFFTDTQLFSKNPPEEANAVSVTTKEDPAKDAPTGDAATDKKTENHGDRPRKKRPETPSDKPDTVQGINDKWESRFNRQARELKELKDRDAKREAEMEAYRKDKMQNTASTRVEAFRADGKSTKAMAGPEKEFVATLTDEQFALYEKVKEQQPELYSLGLDGDLGEEPGQPLKKPGKVEDVKATVKSLKDKYNKKGGTKSDA